MLGRLFRFARKIILHPVQSYHRLHWIVYAGGLYGVWTTLCGRPNIPLNLNKWFSHYRPGPRILAKMRKRAWPENAPLFSVLLCTYNTPALWLREALNSVQNQLYPHWELICVNDASPEPHVVEILKEYAAADARIRVIDLPKNQGVSAATNAGLRQAKGQYVCFMDHDDMLEPQALYRFAEAALQENSDIIYSDEVQTGEDIHEIEAVHARPVFSYDYYLSHPYMVHLIGVRRAIAEKIGGLDEQFKVSQDYDFVLRALVHAKKVTHVNDILYRWRTVKTSLGHQRADEVMRLSTRAIARHLEQTGLEGAEVKAGKSFNFFDVTYPVPPRTRIAVIIPTKDQAGLLRQCIESLHKTVPAALADIYVVDHDSREAETLALFEEIKTNYGVRVLPHSGPFNFATINNEAVARLPQPYSQYLFLNNDTEAMQPGWLEHMATRAARPDVGAVGALLLYPDMTVQHAGVVVGLNGGTADHSHRFHPFYRPDKNLSDGMGGALKCVRDYSAVTAACMLVNADAFHAVGGYDEQIAVGFGDTDLCLRIVQGGWRVLSDPYAVLLHHESVSRGKSEGFDPHPKDTKRFMQRYARFMREADPFSNALIDVFSDGTRLRPGVRSQLQAPLRSQTVRRPELAKQAFAAARPRELASA